MSTTVAIVLAVALGVGAGILARRDLDRSTDDKNPVRVRTVRTVLTVLAVTVGLAATLLLWSMANPAGAQEPFPPLPPWEHDDGNWQVRLDVAGTSVRLLLIDCTPDESRQIWEVPLSKNAEGLWEGQIPDQPPAFKIDYVSDRFSTAAAGVETVLWVDGAAVARSGCTRQFQNDTVDIPSWARVVSGHNEIAPGDETLTIGYETGYAEHGALLPGETVDTATAPLAPQPVITTTTTLCGDLHGPACETDDTETGGPTPTTVPCNSAVECAAEDSGLNDGPLHSGRGMPWLALLIAVGAGTFMTARPGRTH